MALDDITEHLLSKNAAEFNKAFRAFKAYLAEDPSDPDIITKLGDLLREKDIEFPVQKVIIEYFSTIDDDTVLDSVRWARHNATNSLVRRQAWLLLEERFEGDEIDKLILVTKHHLNGAESISAMRELPITNDQRIVSALKTTALTHRNRMVRQAAGEKLIKIQGKKCVSMLTTAIITGKLSHYFVRTHLVRNGVKFDEKAMMTRIRQHAPQDVLDEIEKVARNMRNR